MEHHALNLEFKGTRLFAKYIAPDTVLGVVVVVHGMGEHSGRYQNNVIPELLECSLAVVVYDNVGHGKSGGKRGHCPSYGALLDILDMVLEKTGALFPGKPLFLYGHSMGGNLVLNYALRRNRDLKGIVASSPYLKLAFSPPKWKMLLGKLMLHIMPSITLPSGLDAKGISRVPEEVEAYKKDALVHDSVSPMFSFPVMDAGRWAIANSGSLKTNTLLLHGTSDAIIDHRATMDFHENATVTTLKLFEKGYHELHHDLCREEMLSVVQNWFQEQLK